MTKTIEDKNGHPTDLFNFEPVMSTLRDHSMISTASFIDVMSKYIQTQIELLQTDIENKVPSKRPRLSSTNNEAKGEPVGNHESSQNDLELSRR